MISVPGEGSYNAEQYAKEQTTINVMKCNHISIYLVLCTKLQFYLNSLFCEVLHWVTAWNTSTTQEARQDPLYMILN